MEEFEVLKNQIENNIIDWYPFEENIDYKILKNFTKDNINELEKAINELNENGKILILLDNDLSVKNICQGNNKNNLFNRQEIEKLLDQNGLVFRKFYYPLPDCNTTNVIFTDKNLPNEETISRNIVFYEENCIEKNNQNMEFKKLLNQDNNLFKIFANSFFIECSKQKFEDNGIEFISYSNMRKEEYKIKTVIKENSVLKTAASTKSSNHIENIKKNIDLLNDLKIDTLDTYDRETIISNYQRNKETLDKTLAYYLKNNELNKVLDIISNLFKELKEKLQVTSQDNNVFDKYKIEYKKEDINNLTFVKYGFWDMIFQNIFYIDNKYFFFDQEWMDENVPLEFIIYRAITYNIELQTLIKSQDIFNKCNINEKNLDLFIKLDNKLQEKIRSEISWKLHTKVTNLETMQNIINEKNKRIKFLEDNMEQTCQLLRNKEQELEYVKGSMSWKITRPLRKIRGKMHLKKGK